MSLHEHSPRRSPGAASGSSGQEVHRKDTARPRPLTLSRVTLDDLAVVLGQSYVDGPFACLYCRRRSSLMSAYIVDDTLARCGRCGREITLGRLRRHVTEDPVLARSLRRLLAVAV